MENQKMENRKIENGKLKNIFLSFSYLLIFSFTHFLIYLFSIQIALAQPLGPFPDNYLQGQAYVEVTGKASIDGNKALAKDMALADALRRAVEEVIRGIVPIERIDTQTIHEKIYKNAMVYILHYRINSEEEVVEGDGTLSYSVSIGAMVDKDLLKKALLTMGIIEEVGGVRAIRLTIHGVGDYRDFEEIRKAIGRVKGVKDISYKSFSKGRIELTLEVIGDIGSIKDSLDLKGMECEVVVSQEGIDIKVMGKPR